MNFQKTAKYLTNLPLFFHQPLNFLIFYSFSHFARNPLKNAVFIIKVLRSVSGGRCEKMCMSMRVR